MARESYEPVEIDVELLHETDKAILVSDGDTEVWLPLSQITYREGADDMIHVTLPEWLAMDKGLI